LPVLYCRQVKETIALPGPFAGNYSYGKLPRKYGIVFTSYPLHLNGIRRMDMELNPLFIKYVILSVISAISGFFLIGFFIYIIYALINWFSKKKDLVKVWGGLIGICLNGLIFLLTFPTVYPVIREALKKVLFKFR
jgi:hypothetical protein